MSNAGPGTGQKLGKDRWTRPAVVLVATDLTDLDRLMPFAFEQAGETGARLILLHVLPAGEGIALDAAGMPIYDPSPAMELASKKLEPWCAEARINGIPCNALVREGNASHHIEAVVRQFRADRVLLGSRSAGKLGKLFLGSVTEKVLQSVKIPVITVGPEAHFKAASEGQERVVLHATNLGQDSGQNAALACRMAASQGAKLVLLHVLPPMDEMEKMGLPTGLESAALSELRLLSAKTGAAENSAATAIEPHVVHGNPTIEILAEAAERHASLIVLGAPHHNSLQSLARDRIVYRVLAHACCPVLTLGEQLVKPAEAESERLPSYQ